MLTEKFVKKAREVQWEWYDYSKVDNEHGAKQDVNFKLLHFMAKTHKYPK